MFDLVPIIQSLGLFGIVAIIFAESGLFFGFFLPGDSLLFTAGLLASQGYLPLFTLIGLSFVAAVLGDNVGYWSGKKIGPRIFTREDSFFFNKKHIERSQLFFERHGKKSIILARFIPVIRTFTPILAGVGTMNYKDFITYNIIGGALWTAGMILLGVFFGNTIPNPDRYIWPVVIFIILTSFIPNIKDWIVALRKKS